MMICTRVRDTLTAIAIKLEQETTPDPRHVEYLFAVSDEIVDHLAYQLLGCALQVIDRIAMFSDDQGVLFGLGKALRGLAVAWAEHEDIAPPDDSFVADLDKLTSPEQS